MAAPQGWSKLYDQLPEHPKILAAGPTAGWLYVCGQAYCSRHLTDGRIPKDAVPMLSMLKRWRKDVDSLLKSGLWHDEKDHYQQHDYCEMQRTASDVTAMRYANKERQRKSRLSRCDNSVSHGEVTLAEVELEKSTDKLPMSGPSGPDVGGWRGKIEKLPVECEQIIRKKWLPHATLPASTTSSAKAQFRMLDTLRLLHTVDKQSWDTIGVIVLHAASVWKPKGYIGSPASLRENTASSDQKKWEAILSQINADHSPTTDNSLDELLEKIKK